MTERDPSPDQSPGTKPAVRIVRAGPEHVEAMAEFFRQVWDPGATPQSVLDGRRLEAVQNPAAGGKEPPTFLFLSGQRVIGYISTIPTRIYAGGVERPMHWMKGLMVLPEFRNGPIGLLVAKEAVKHLDGALSMAVALPARRIFTSLGFSDLGPIPNRLRILSAGRLLSRLDLEAVNLPVPSLVRRGIRLLQRIKLAGLVGYPVTLAMRGWSRLSARDHGFTIQHGSDVASAELDGLWRRVREYFPAAAVRDGAYVAWKYGGEEAAEYRVITVRDRDSLIAFAAVRRPRDEGDARLKGLRIATLCDLIYPTNAPQAGLAALRGVERLAGELNADGILATASHADALKVLGRAAYLPVPGNVHLLVRQAKSTNLPESLSGWWLSRADGDSDGVL